MSVAPPKRKVSSPESAEPKSPQQATEKSGDFSVEVRQPTEFDDETFQEIVVTPLSDDFILEHWTEKKLIVFFLGDC